MNNMSKIKERFSPELIDPKNIGGYYQSQSKSPNNKLKSKRIMNKPALESKDKLKSILKNGELIQNLKNNNNLNSNNKGYKKKYSENSFVKKKKKNIIKSKKCISNNNLYNLDNFLHHIKYEEDINLPFENIEENFHCATLKNVNAGSCKKNFYNQKHNKNSMNDMNYIMKFNSSNNLNLQNIVKYRNNYSKNSPAVFDKRSNMHSNTKSNKNCNAFKFHPNAYAPTPPIRFLSGKNQNSFFNQKNKTVAIDDSSSNVNNIYDDNSRSLYDIKSCNNENDVAKEEGFQNLEIDKKGDMLYKNEYVLSTFSVDSILEIQKVESFDICNNSKQLQDSNIIQEDVIDTNKGNKINVKKRKFFCCI